MTSNNERCIVFEKNRVQGTSHAFEFSTVTDAQIFLYLRYIEATMDFLNESEELGATRKIDVSSFCIKNEYKLYIKDTLKEGDDAISLASSAVIVPLEQSYYPSITNNKGNTDINKELYEDIKRKFKEELDYDDTYALLDYRDDYSMVDIIKCLMKLNEEKD